MDDEFIGINDYIGTPDEIYCSKCDVWSDHVDEDHED